ncbi:MAG: hypothetical protein DHS20C17_30390 [Cyclobacteriaceae bacterium]|nr:MAG: hypothetical protein DHS20C17_30390 [Cyclobacteriaceae bacterium]
MRHCYRVQITLCFFVLLFTACGPSGSPDEINQNWYKGNLHTHSFWSDGDEFPEVIMEWYKEHGYHFVALTDHNILANKEHWVEMKDSLRQATFQRYLDKYGNDWVDFKSDSGRIMVKLKTLDQYLSLFQEKERFLILPAEEISDSYEGKPLHLNATNIEQLIEPQGGSSVVDVLQRNINALMEQRETFGKPMLIHINHPNFYFAITIEDMIALQGEQFFEVYNGHHMVYNLGDSMHIDTETMWDQINIAYLTSGKPPLYGLATDDSHNYHTFGNRWSNSGRGWINVQADSLSPESLIRSMEQGRFYASTGVELVNTEVIENTIYVEIADSTNSYRVQFIGCLKDDSKTRILKEESGYQASYKLNSDHLFVRAKIISSKPPVNPIENMPYELAWTQPVVFSE